MRLILVSNRLPFAVSQKGGEIRFQRSTGGLVSSLNAYLERPSFQDRFKKYLWLGWAGGFPVESEQEEVEKQAFTSFHSNPIFFSEKSIEKFYHGFCNKTIWPLFHYFPSLVVYDEGFWQSYVKANEAFRDAVLKVVESSDCIWVHDYQLMLLPKLLRMQLPHATIGYFHHIPFPSFELFRLLPVRWSKALLQGLLGADLIGFHTYDYTQYFLRCVLRLLGLEHHLGNLQFEGRPLNCDTYPLGIDFEKFFNLAKETKVGRKQDDVQRSQTQFIFSVDRLDYTKGIVHRLNGFERFLEKYPSWRGKVVLILQVVPSRTAVESYQSMKRQIDERVGNINGKFGTLQWMPILYQYKSLSPSSLAHHYSSSDIALLTPLRDGMNLVAKEYVASRIDQTGVLILSDMTGAAKELGEALLINPNDLEQIADSLNEALEMPVEEQKRRMEWMQARLKRYDVISWANHFISDLFATKEEQKAFSLRLLNTERQREVLFHWKSAKQRLIFLDYDGTLRSFERDPLKAKPTEEILQILRKLIEKPHTDVVLVSERPKNILNDWFSKLSMYCVAEHGVWIREKNGEWLMPQLLSSDWKTKLYPILETFADRLPGAFVEEKEFCLVWHYRHADPELAQLRARELVDELTALTASMSVQVLHGNKIVEVRNQGVDKASTGLFFLSKGNYDFILSLGDDRTDEDLFQVLPAQAWTIKVGTALSHARFYLQDVAAVLEFLNRF